MDTKRYFKNIFLWLIPAIFLLISLLPITFPVFFPLILEIVVSLAALLIAYLLFTEKPKYYIIWGVVFILIVLIFNPLIKLSIIMGVAIPLALVAAAIFLANWWFVFRNR